VGPGAAALTLPAREEDMTDRTYAALRCPDCGASPEPSKDLCPDCGRRARTNAGGLDLLADDLREAADRFAADYRALRSREGWVGAGGREDPAGGDRRLWRGRVQSVKHAARIFEQRLAPTEKALILDVGSGGAWAAGHLPHADVIAIDLLEVGATPALSVRADMRRLPVRTAAADGLLFAASLHYARLDEAVPEAARVLRAGGLLIAVDSPIYRRPGDEARAAARSRAYYAAAGYPRLADHYFPIDASRLRQILLDASLRLERLDVRPRWSRVRRDQPSSLVLASRLR